MFTAREVGEIANLANDLAGAAPIEVKAARVLDGLAVLMPFDQSAAVLTDPIQPARAALLISRDLPRSQFDRYLRDHAAHDPSQRNRRGAHFGPRRLRGAISDAELLHTPYYNEYLRPHGIRYTLGVSVRLPSERTLSFGGTRAPDRTEFADKELTALRILRPFLESHFYDAALGAADLRAERFIVDESGSEFPLAADDGHYRGPPVPAIPDLAPLLPDLGERLPREVRAVALTTLAHSVGLPEPIAWRLECGRVVAMRPLIGTVARALEVTVHATSGPGLELRRA